jgi:hypothetical protein
MPVETESSKRDSHMVSLNLEYMRSDYESPTKATVLLALGKKKKINIKQL